MKRLLLLVAVAVCAVAAIPFAATANHSNGTGPKFEKANGTGESSSYGRVHVNADDNGKGQDLGHFFIGPPNGPVEMQGDVTCLRVDGNTALVGGRDRQTNMPFLIEVRDNGEPGAGRDQHRWRPAMPNEVTGNCGNFGNNPPPATIQQGNYIVHDGG